MVRNVDRESRRRQVLEAAINRYIREAVPVASDDIAREFDLSSATIRNIFAELEESGFLTHPYTSGGRMPTDRGYRYYVDFLISQNELLDEEKKRMVREYKRETKRLEDALEEASEFISSETHYAGIVSFLEWEDKLFSRGLSRVLEQPEFKEYNKIRFFVRAMEDKHRLLDIINRDFDEKVKVYIGHELGTPEMENCALVVSSYRVKNKPSGKLAVLGPMRMEYRFIMPTLEYISELVTEVFEGI
mgnify:CR=1 FL=1